MHTLSNVLSCFAGQCPETRHGPLTHGRNTMDRRQKKTRAAIFEAFRTLLAQKKYNHITVQEIIDAADVGRTTFYAHFPTKDALLGKMCTSLFEHVFFRHAESETTHDFSLAEGDPEQLITHLLYHLRDSRENIIGLLSCESSDLFLRYFKEYLNQFTADYLLRGARPPAGIPEDFIIDQISGSFVNMVQWWIGQKLKQPPETLARYYMAVISPTLGKAPRA